MPPKPEPAQPGPIATYALAPETDAAEWNATSSSAFEPPNGYDIVSVVVSAVASAPMTATTFVEVGVSAMYEPSAT